MNKIIKNSKFFTGSGARVELDHEYYCVEI